MSSFLNLIVADWGVVLSFFMLIFGGLIYGRW